MLFFFRTARFQRAHEARKMRAVRKIMTAMSGPEARAPSRWTASLHPVYSAPLKKRQMLPVLGGTP